MTSQKKIVANRRNAKKSTGPRSERGKALTRFNAVQYGIYADQQLLPGENGKAYNGLYRRVATECQPVGLIEEIIAEKIVRSIWRLRRLEEAEESYLRHSDYANLLGVVDSLSERQRKLFELIIYQKERELEALFKTDTNTMNAKKDATTVQGQKITGELTRGEFTRKDLSSVKVALSEALSSGSIYLGAIVSKDEENPMEKIDRMRRKLFNDILKTELLLEARQERRLARSTEGIPPFDSES